MGKALEVIGGQATAPSGTLTSLTMNAGDSAQVKNADLASWVGLLQLWARNNAAGILEVRSPKLHDNVHNMRYRIPATDPNPLLSPGTYQRLVPQDNLILQLSGSAVGGQIEQAAFLLYYVDLPGQAARLLGFDEMMKRTVNITAVEVAVAPGVAGGWSGAVAINSTFDLLQANTDYAVLGFAVDAQCTAVSLKGPDTSNLRVGGPGIMNAVTAGASGRWVTERWFQHLTEKCGVPLIPVINSANKAATIIEVMQNQAGAAVNVTWMLHQLAPAGAQGFSYGIK